jgi:hypothetical protein
MTGSKLARGGQPGNRNARRDGVRRTQIELRELQHAGTEVIDQTPLGPSMRVWRADLIVDLGGQENLTVQELALVDATVRTKTLLEAVDHWLFCQPRLASRRRGLLPVVVQRATLLHGLRGLLSDLGLKRRQRDVESLATYLARRERERAQASGNAEVIETNGDGARDDRP